MINQSSSTSEKIALFVSFFRGRVDVYPRRIETRGQFQLNYELAIPFDGLGCM
jgi:hypothetical protein